MARGDLSLFDDPRVIPTLGVLSSGLGMLSGQGAGQGINSIIDALVMQREQEEALRQQEEALRKKQIMSRAGSEYERLGRLPVGFLLQSGVEPLVDLGTKLAEAQAKSEAPGPQAKLAASMRSSDPIERAAAMSAAGLVPSDGGEYISTAMATLRQQDLSRAQLESQFLRRQAAIESRFQRTPPPQSLSLNYDEEGRPIINYGAQIAGQKEAEKITATAQAQAKVQLPAVEDAVNTTFKLLDDLVKHPGFKSAVGATLKPYAKDIHGTDEGDFVALLEQVKNRAFVEGVKFLRETGGPPGNMTELEGEKAEGALSRAKIKTSEKAFMQAIGDFKAILEKGRQRARKAAIGDFSVEAGLPEQTGAGTPGVTVEWLD